MSKALKDCCTIELSSVDKKSKPNQKAVRLCNFTDVYYNWNIYDSMDESYMEATASDESIKKLSLEKGDVVITKDSETREDIGMSAYVAEDVNNLVLGYHCALIRPNDDVDGAWLNGFLSSRYGRKYFSFQSSGSGQRYTLTKESIGAIKIPDIGLNTQKSIGHFLTQIDKKIRLNTKISALLETQAKVIYDYWFTQFDFPDEHGKPYKSSGGKMVWNAELKREIPEGWEVGNLYTIADLTNGLACQKYRPKDGDDGLKVIKIKEMHEGITVDTELVSSDIPEKYIIDNGDILFSWSATLEVMYWCGGKAGLNQHIFKIEPKLKYSSEYVYHQFSNYVVNFVKMADSRRTTMGHITSDHIKQSRIIIAPSHIVEQYSQNVKTTRDMIFNYNQENQKLFSLRYFLLPLLMNGQCTIGE